MTHPARPLRLFAHRFAPLALTLVTALCALTAGAAHAQAILPGTVSLRERIVLPPDAVLDVALEDVTSPDEPPHVLGRAHVEPAGRLPIRFGVGYAPARIDPRHSYALRAAIKQGDTLMFVTDIAYPIKAEALAQGEPSRADLLLRRSTDPVADEAAAPDDAPLIDTVWRLKKLAGTPVKPNPGQPGPHLVLHAPTDAGLARVSGSDGCNRFSGSYHQDGTHLSFGPTVGTKKACPAGGQQAQAYRQVLSRVAQWHVDGNQLDLQDAAGQELARFEMRVAP